MRGAIALTPTRVIALVTAGVVAGGVGGAVISQLGVAGAASPSPRPSSGAPWREGPRGLMPHGGPGGMAALGLLGGGRVLHGEATVAKPGGGTMTVRFQNGVISDISGSTITVKSSDGFTSTFTVNGTTRISLNGSDGTLSKLAKNDKVRVVGVQQGSSMVARMVLDGVVADRGMFDGLRGRMEKRFMRPGMMPAAPPGQAG